MSEFSLGTVPSSDAKDWDPPTHRRTYFKHATDGQLGWLVKRSGRQMIRMDREPETLRPMNDAEWIPDKEHRPLNKGQVAQVCFAADRALCTALGMHKEGKREWVELRQEEKAVWMQAGPDKPKVRQVVFERISAALEHLTV